MTNILKAAQLTKTFGNVKALDHCDLEIRKGEIFGYLGPSGAGKTTTIKLLTGQLHSDSGQITVFGKDPFSPDIKRQIGIMSDMSGLYEKMTVYENLDIFSDIYGIRDKKNMIRKALQAVDLLGSAKKDIRERKEKLHGLGKYDHQRYYLEEEINNFCDLFLMLSLSLAEAESGAKYYFKNSIKPDKETILYCALRAADIIDDDEMWKEIYKYGLSQKIKPRDELTREYREKTR